MNKRVEHTINCANRQIKKGTHAYLSREIADQKRVKMTFSDLRAKLKTALVEK